MGAIHLSRFLIWETRNIHGLKSSPVPISFDNWSLFLFQISPVAWRLQVRGLPSECFQVSGLEVDGHNFSYRLMDKHFTSKSETPMMCVPIFS